MGVVVLAMKTPLWNFCIRSNTPKIPIPCLWKNSTTRKLNKELVEDFRDFPIEVTFSCENYFVIQFFCTHKLYHWNLLVKLNTTPRVGKPVNGISNSAWSMLCQLWNFIPRTSLIPQLTTRVALFCHSLCTISDFFSLRKLIQCVANKYNTLHGFWIQNSP